MYSSNLEKILRECPKCKKQNDIKNTVKKTRTTSVQGFGGSSGCTISTFYFCKGCEPQNDDDLPPSKSTILVGQVIEI